MDWPSYLVAGGLGGLVGVTELASRYKSRPGLALLTLPGLMYAVVNVAAACGALLLVRQFGWTLGMQPADPGLPAAQVLVAGFGAMALLRSSVFVVRVGDRDVGVGPGIFLSGTMEVVDAAVARRVDQGRARIRGRLARMAMRSLDFERAVVALPTYCLALSTAALPTEDVVQLAERIKSLSASSLANEQKIAVLGLVCIDAFGEAIVATAVDEFGDTMFVPVGSSAAVAPEGPTETPGHSLNPSTPPDREAPNQMPPLSPAADTPSAVENLGRE